MMESLTIKLVKQIYLHVVTEVATCDKLGPNGFLAIKDLRGGICSSRDEPVIDLYEIKTLLT